MDSSSRGTIKVTDLPPDVLYNVFPYLSLRDFVDFTSCTRALFPYRHDPTFWSVLTRKDFRLPPQPLLKGKRWHCLYQKLLTQTRLYTWGDNKSGNLGHAMSISPNFQRQRPYAGSLCSGWPRQPQIDIDLGIVSDVQCGGWSTTLLNSHGSLFVMGHLDGMGIRQSRHRNSNLRKLTFPRAWNESSHDNYVPSTAIKQYSTGRSNVLGLSDDGKVWEWRTDTAVLINSLNVDLSHRLVAEVQAGWNRSAILVRGVGIMYWSSEHESDLIPGGRQESLSTGDSLMVNMAIIPGTSSLQTSSKSASEEGTNANIGAIKQFIILENHIVFTTNQNRIFSYNTAFPLSESAKPEPVELTSFFLPNSDNRGEKLEVRHLVGSFSNFAIFVSESIIWTADRAFLERCQNFKSSQDADEPLPRPTQLPLLQKGDVVSLSFGDHHFHAVHSDGSVSSFGTECQASGALGLGDRDQSQFRGVTQTGSIWGDARIPKETKQKHTVWFEPLMERWMECLIKNTFGEGDAAEHSQSSAYSERMGAWFEKKGALWMRSNEGESRRVSTTTGNHAEDFDDSNDEDDLPAYFTLKTASAGWHSAALVLVDEAKAQASCNRYKLPPQPESPPKPAMHWIWALGRRFLGLEEHGEDRRIAGEYIWEHDTLPDFR